MILLENKLSIGKVAKLKGVSIRSLRYYDKINILKPNHVDKFTNYRYYDPGQLLLVEIISFFRQSGATLQEIADACKGDDVIKIAEFATTQINNAEEKIKKLEDNIKIYKELCSRIYNDKVNAKNTEPYWKKIDKKTILSAVVPPGENKEWMINGFWNLYQKIRDYNLSTIYGTGYIIDFDVTNKKQPLNYKKIYVEASHSSDSAPIEMDSLPMGECLCVNYRLENKKEQVEKLRKAVLRMGTPPCLCLEVDTYTNFTTYDNTIEEMQVMF